MLPTFSGDCQQLRSLLLWISKLGERKNHCALIVADAGTPFDEVIALRELAETIFTEVRVTTNHVSVKGWPAGASSLFKAAATYIHQKWPQAFLWMEPDTVPLKPGWLDEIEKSYEVCGAKFFGMIYGCAQPFLPAHVMSAIAVYPPDVIKLLPDLPQSPRPWDVDGADVMVSQGMDWKLIHHFYGQQNLPPTFVAQKTSQSPVNAMTLEDIPKEAVIFHRDKQHSLIRLLERKLFPNEFKHPIAVCFNVHAGDLNLAILHSQWLRTLALKTPARRWAHKAIICHDPSCPVVGLNLLEQNLRHCFAEVESFVYPRPGIPTYPASANFAFQSVAMHMAHGNNPWFWFEADAIALKPDWIEQLQAEYDSCGKSWMGSIVPHLDHIQGTAIYPADAATRMPNAMRCGADHAFDMAAREDTLHDRHDASHLLFCVWTIMPDGTPSPVGGGNLPVSLTAEWARRHIPRSSVFIHRVKNDSLVRELLSGAQL